jgi:hypothetical protein
MPHDSAYYSNCIVSVVLAFYIISFSFKESFFCTIVCNVDPSHENDDSRVPAQPIFIFIL